MRMFFLKFLIVLSFSFLFFVLMAPEATTIKSIYVGGVVGHLIVGTTNL